MSSNSAHIETFFLNILRDTIPAELLADDTFTQDSDTIDLVKGMTEKAKIYFVAATYIKTQKAAVEDAEKKMEEDEVKAEEVKRKARKALASLEGVTFGTLEGEDMERLETVKSYLEEIKERKDEKEAV